MAVGSELSAILESKSLHVCKENLFAMDSGLDKTSSDLQEKVSSHSFVLQFQSVASCFLSPYETSHTLTFR